MNIEQNDYYFCVVQLNELYFYVDYLFRNLHACDTRKKFHKNEYTKCLKLLFNISRRIFDLRCTMNKIRPSK